MKITAVTVAAVVAITLMGRQQQITAFVVASSSTSSSISSSVLHASVDTEKAQKKAGGASVDLGIPCEDECALMKFPNLPDSIYPGVLSGQAQIDLLNHAKENGKCLNLNLCASVFE